MRDQRVFSSTTSLYIELTYFCPYHLIGWIKDIRRGMCCVLAKLRQNRFAAELWTHSPTGMDQALEKSLRLILDALWTVRFHCESHQ